MSSQSTENALSDSFKAAAVHVTGLYKDALGQNRRAYGQGYQQAMRDLLDFVSSPQRSSLSTDEVLQYARQKNQQLLTTHEGLGSNSSSSSNSSDNGSSSSGSSGHTTTAASATTEGPIINAATTVFQIDPTTQFQFAASPRAGIPPPPPPPPVAPTSSFMQQRSPPETAVSGGEWGVKRYRIPMDIDSEPVTTKRFRTK